MSSRALPIHGGERRVHDEGGGGGVYLHNNPIIMIAIGGTGGMYREILF